MQLREFSLIAPKIQPGELLKAISTVIAPEVIAEAIVVNDDRVTVRRSNGSSFTGNESWTQNPYYGTRGTYFADVNGDLSADAIVVNDDRVTARPSIAGVFVSMESEMINLRPKLA